MSNRALKWAAIVGLVLALLLASVGSVAAFPSDNPGKGPPNIGKIVFVHHPKDVPAKGGIPGSPEGKEEKSGKLWYKYSGIHWADSDIAVPYVVNLANSSDDGSFLSGIQASFQTWEDDSESYMDFNYSGSFEGIPSNFIGGGTMNGVNEVGWTSLSADYSNAIGVTLIWYYTLTQEIVEVDTAMNSDLPWSQTAVIGDPDEVKGNTGAYDVQNIMTHESGHWLLLEDMYNNPAKQQTMYGYGTTDELKKRSLESGDEAGIREIYAGATKP
jgi:hypothetical protein